MRFARRVAISLILGALGSLLIAWGCALWSAVSAVGAWHFDGRSTSSTTSGIAPPPWLREAWRYDEDLIRADYEEAAGLGLILGATNVGRNDGPYRRWEHGRYWRAGWPLAAFECYVAWDHGPIAEVPHAAIRAPRGIHAEDRRLPDSPGYLPIRPLAGFAADTVIYAALALLLWHAFLMIRRALQRKPGCCTTCGYDRAGLAPESKCPECGAAPQAELPHAGHAAASPSPRRS